MVKRTSRGGNIFGSGSFAEVIDINEVTDIKFFDTSFRLVNETIPFEKIVFKRFKNIKNKINVREVMKLVNRKFTNPKIDIDIPKDYQYLVLELVNMLIISDLPIKSSLVQVKNRKLLFAVINKTDIFPVYQVYDGDVKTAMEKKLIDFDTYLNLIETILHTVKVLHMNFMYHFDIKPENILYRKDLSSNSLEFVLSDYGLLGNVYGDGFKGTPMYQSPLTVFGYQCEEDDNECQEKKPTYDEIHEFFMETALALSVTTEDCAKMPNSEEIGKNITENCEAYKANIKNFSNKLKNRYASKNLQALVLNVDKTLENLCGVNFKIDCQAASNLSRDIMSIIFQKNELHALGITIRNVFAAVVGKESLEAELIRSINTFVQLLTHATLFKDITTEQEDIYFCEEALSYFDYNIKGLYIEMTQESRRRKPVNNNANNSNSIWKIKRSNSFI